MLDFLYTYVCSLISCTAFYYIGYALCGEGQKFFKLKNIILLLVSVLVISLLFLVVDMNLKLPLYYYIFTVFFLLAFKKPSTSVMVAALIGYVLIIISDFPILIGYIVLHYLAGDMFEFVKETLMANILVFFISISLFFLLKKPIMLLYQKLSNSKKIDIFILAPLFLLAIGTVFFKAGISGWMYDESLILNLILVIIFTWITIYLLKEKLNNIMIKESYQELGNYVKNSEQLIEEYRIVQHENKNQLVVIKTMVNKDNEKLLEYLDGIIKDDNSIKYKWITSLQNIPLDCVKGLIHFKLLKMEELGLSIDIHVSKEILNSVLNNFPISEWDNLGKILGVFLDNALEAASESEKKEFIMDIYLEKDNVVMELVNSFNEVTKNGDSFVSTKNKDRGHGLKLVNRIIKSSKRYNHETRIADGYFIQILKIKKSTI